ncbi:plasmid mobilization protein [Enterococcus olivae]
MANRKRTYQKIVRFNEEELMLLSKKMSLSNTKNFEQYARKMLLNGLVIHKDFSDIRESILQITRIGTNINQIAKKVNGTNSVNREDMNILLSNYQQLSEELQSSLLKHIYDDR